MNRSIRWETGVMDEIELIYEKAENNADIAAALERLEKQAIEEVENTGIAFSGAAGEIAIKKLAAAGFGGIGRDMDKAVITIRLSYRIQNVMACTVFEILNRLEKLDGTLDMLKPKWTLELQVPLGGRKGLFQWEMLMMQLYPWISVRETATNEAAEEKKAAPAAEGTERDSQGIPTRQEDAETGGGAAPETGEKQDKPEKKTFWKKLFGK